MLTPEELAGHLQTIRLLRSQGLSEEADKYERNLLGADPTFGTEKYLDKLWTCNLQMMKLKEIVRKLAHEDDPVLISGESGTGKELLARALHGDRDARAFVALNCAGMPENLLESELFGHVRGAFTGADTTKKGLMEQACDGTLFFDEIGELPLMLQPKLLRALQERVIRPVGGRDTVKINCRVISATNRCMRNMIRDGLFRLDLYARLCTFELDTIPLMVRPEDIDLILSKLMPEGKHFPDDLKNSIDYSLNVRGLEIAVRRYLVLGKV